MQVRRSGARRPAAGRWDLASTGSCPGRPFAVVGKDAAQLHLGGIVPWRHGCGVRHGLAAPAPLGMRMCLGLQWTWGRIRRFNPPALAAGDAGYCRGSRGVCRARCWLVQLSKEMDTRRLYTIHVCAPCDTLFSFCLCLVVQAATVPRIRGGLSTLSMAHFVNNKVGTSLNLRPRGAVVRTAHSSTADGHDGRQFRA